MLLRRIDFENVNTYKNLASVGLFIFSGTGLYSMKHLIIWLGPVVILVYGGVAFGYMFTQQQTKSPQMFEAGLIWLFWLVYGKVFATVPLVMLSQFENARQLAIVFSIALSYWNPVFVTTKTFAFFVIFSLLFPNSDMIADGMDKDLLFIKITLFYFLFFICEITCLMKEKNSPKLSNVSASAQQPFKIPRSAWVLFVSKYALLLSIVQFIWFFWEVYKNVDNIDPILPITNEVVRDVKVELDSENEKKNILNDRTKTKTKTKIKTNLKPHVNPKTPKKAKKKITNITADELQLLMKML